MTDNAPDAMPEYYIISRGLYFRPDAQGYTGLRDQAGLYTKEVADSYEATTVHKNDAPEFLPTAYHDVVVNHLKAQRDEYRDRHAALLKLAEDMAKTLSVVGNQCALSSMAMAGNPGRQDDMKMHAIWAGQLQRALSVYEQFMNGEKE